MRLVDRPRIWPNHCAAMPHVGQMTVTRWVDTGSDVGPTAREHRIYLSETAVAIAARLLGWVPGGELRAAQRELAATSAALEQARAEVAELQAAWDAIDRVERLGFEAKAKTPSKAKVPA